MNLSPISSISPREPPCECRICTRTLWGGSASVTTLCVIDVPIGRGRWSLPKLASVQVLRRPALDWSTAIPTSLPDTHTLVVCASLNTSLADSPKASISPVTQGTHKVILNLAVDPRHPMLATTTLSCWHHAPSFRHLVVIVTPTLVGAPTAADHAHAAEILDRRSFYRYQPLLGILHRPLSTLALSSHTKVKVTLVGLGALPHRSLGFAKFPVVAGKEMERLVEQRAGQFGNLNVRCLSRLKYSKEIGRERFELESRWC